MAISACVMTGAPRQLGKLSDGPTLPGSIEIELEWTDLQPPSLQDWLSLAGGFVTIHFYPSAAHGLVLEHLGISPPPEPDHPFYAEAARLVGPELAARMASLASGVLAEGHEEFEIDSGELLRSCQPVWQAFVEAHRSGVLQPQPMTSSQEAERWQLFEFVAQLPEIDLQRAMQDSTYTDETDD